MPTPSLACEKCGRIDSTLRVIEFFDGSRGVWCEQHARAERRTADFYQPEGRPETPMLRGPAWVEAASANAKLLADVADELRLRGELAEADKAELNATRYAAQARDGR